MTSTLPAPASLPLDGALAQHFRHIAAALSGTNSGETTDAASIYSSFRTGGGDPTVLHLAVADTGVLQVLWCDHLWGDVAAAGDGIAVLTRTNTTPVTLPADAIAEHLTTATATTLSDYSCGQLDTWIALALRA